MGVTAAAIASESPYTVAAGVGIAEAGGNAVDIAVACAIAATVSETIMCSLGGSAFIALKLPGEAPELIDGADAMPRIPTSVEASKAAWKRAHIPYGDGITVNVGHAAVAVPGMLRAVELAWRRHGSLPWSVLVQPAVDLARSGLTASHTLVKWLAMAGNAVFYEQPESRASFFPDGVNPLAGGDFYVPPHLADSLDLIAREGADALYRGDIGRALEREIQANEGFVTLEDLVAYEPVVRRPILLESHGYRLALNPPPAIGGAMVGSMVQMYDTLWRPDAGDAQRCLDIARVQQAMFSLRHEEATADWGEARADRILERDWLRRYFEKQFPPNTMHLSVATGDGAVVAITMSNGYGSGVSIPGTGIPTNNSLGEPELNPAGFFAIPPGGRLVSNMSPTVAWNDAGPTLALG
jgi:gamma-glutamyltranspeptidase/glutathione hydrolase